MASPAWARFETNKDLISATKITMEETVHAAAKSVPSGKAVEAELGKENGRSLKWKSSTPTRSTEGLIDTQTGRAKVDK